jgi:hypothetical protein
MHRKKSLEETQPYIFVAPYAHTVFFADDTFLVFGEGVVPPPPGSVRYSDAEKDKTARLLESVYRRSSTYVRDKLWMALMQAEERKRAAEMNAHDDLHSSSSLTSSNIPITPSPVPSLEPSPPVTTETTHHCLTTLRPEIFLNPDEGDREINVETYMYGSRGAISVALRSNVQTVIESLPSETEQKMRNRKRCRGVFGKFAETSDNI